MTHPDHTPERLAAGYRASGLGPAEAQAAAEADLAVVGALDVEPGTPASAELAALSAQEYAVWALERVGFTQATSNGRDPFDGMTLVAPGGGVLEIRPVNDVG